MLKRGDSHGLMVIFGAVSLIVLILMVFDQFVPQAAEAAELNVCQFTVTAKHIQSKMTAGAFEDSVIKDLNCHTNFIDITDKEIFLNGRRLEKLKGDRKAQINGLIAQQMQQCWNAFGTGDLDPFGKWSGGDARCVPCAEISFADDFELAEIPGFYQYLNTQTAEGKEETYAQYFFDELVTDVDLLNAPLVTKRTVQQPDLTEKIEGTEYSVIFASVAESQLHAWQTSLAGGLAGCLKGAISGLSAGPWGAAGGCVVAGLGGSLFGFSIGDFFGGATEKHIPSIALVPTANVADKCDRFYE